MVAALVAERMGRIRQICREYRVERLYLFGSAANGEMRPDSDVDFLVEFQEGAQEHFGPGGAGTLKAGGAVGGGAPRYFAGLRRSRLPGSILVGS